MNPVFFLTRTSFPACLIPAILTFPANAFSDEGAGKKDVGRRISIMAFSTSCPAVGNAGTAAAFAAGSVHLKGLVGAPAAGNHSPAPDDVMPAAAKLLAASEREYFSLGYAEAAKAADSAATMLLSASVPEGDEGKRWEMIERATALAALARLGSGDEGSCNRIISELAVMRPGTVFGPSYPPGFRTAFRDAAGRASRLPVSTVGFRALAGKWEVLVDGVPRGTTPVDVRVPAGRHAVCVAGPGGRIGCRHSDAPARGLSVVIDPFADFSVRDGAVTTVCLPSGNEPGAADLAAAAKALGSPSLLAFHASGNTVIASFIENSGTASWPTAAIRAEKGVSEDEVAMVIKRLLGPAVAASPMNNGGPPSTAASRNWYEQWWFWTPIALGIAATAVGVPLYLHFEEGPQKGSLGAITLSR
jgi:hypothetical protein